MFAVPTSATSAEGAIAMAAFGANPNDLAVDVLGVVGVDVTGATATVRNFRSRHFEYATLSRAERFVVASWFCVTQSMSLELDVGREVVSKRVRGDFSKCPDTQVVCGCGRQKSSTTDVEQKGGGGKTP